MEIDAIKIGLTRMFYSGGVFQVILIILMSVKNITPSVQCFDPIFTKLL